MPSLPPTAAPALPPAPAGATQQSVMWVYADAQRTHELHVGLRKQAGLEFVVRERSLGPDATVLETAVPLAAAWESRVHHAQLEERLTLLGGYFRHSVGTGGSWTPVRRASASSASDLLPLKVEGIRQDAQFHFYGSRQDDTSALLVVGRTDVSGRSALARLDFVFPDAAKARLVRIHPALPPMLLRSALAASHVDLRARGLEKLAAVERSSSASRRWCEQLDAVLDVTMRRIAAGAWGGEAPRGTPKLHALASQAEAPAGGRPAVSAARPTVVPGGVARGPARVIAVGAPEQRRPGSGGWRLPERLRSDENPYEIEYADPEAAEKGPDAPVATIEDNTLDFHAALMHPRILALHERYLRPGDEAAMFAQGELALRAAMKAKRQTAGPHEQHLLSILEASLLVRYALRPGGDGSIDPRAKDLLRRALVYLG